MVADIRNCQCILTDGVLDPLPTHHFFRDLQPEHVSIKFTRSFQVCNGNTDKTDFLDFHVSLREVPNPNSQIPSKVSIPNKSKRVLAHVPPLFEMIEEKIRVNSRASDANASQLATLSLP